MKNWWETYRHITMSFCRCNPFHLNKYDVTVSHESELQATGGPKTSKNIPSLNGQVLDKRKFKESKLGHRRVAEDGQVTFKKIQTSQIMGSIQLGIGHAVNSLPSKPERDLLMLDFMIVETVSFPRDGSNITPAHHYSDFKFKSYAPVAFRYFRDLFGIKPDDYLLSLCKYPMKELTNPGASGSIFYVTDDGEFIIKTVQHREAEFIKRLLPGYYMNLHENPRTLLPKYFGLYCYICGGKNIRLVVMNNLLPTSIKIHKKYDLKGSTYRRKASEHEKKKSSPTLKDLDFIERQTDGINIEPRTYNALIKTITRDCCVLESFDIIDYSLLVGIHNVDIDKQEKLEEKGKKNEGSQSIGNMLNDSGSDSFVKSDLSLKKNKLISGPRLTVFSTAMESIHAEIKDADEDEDTLPEGIPAKNAKGEHLLLFLGIIDILQSFRIKKKLEHAWKSLLYDGDTVSVHQPGFYAQRFQGFMSKKVFKKAPALKYSSLKRKCVFDKHRLLSITEAETSRTYHLPKIPEDSEYTHDEGSSRLFPSYIMHRKLPLSNFSKSEKTASVCDANIKSNSNLKPPSRINPWTTSTISWFHCTVTGGDMNTENMSAHFNFISP